MITRMEEEKENPDKEILILFLRGDGTPKDLKPGEKENRATDTL